MSCMPISFEALAAVRETLVSSYHWKEQTDNKPLGLHHAFTGSYGWNLTHTRTMAQKFVECAYVFNYIEYFKGEPARTNSEPIEWGRALCHIAKCNPSRKMSIMQLYKTMQMIDYNTDALGWMTENERDSWTRLDDYKTFKQTIRRTISFLAEFIVSRLDDYMEAEWDFH